MFRKRLSIFLSLLLSLLGLATVLGALTVTAAPATITVDTLMDENDGCDVGNCSLRDAIAEAIPGDVIDFSVSGVIDISTNGELVVDKSLTISSSLPITISGGNATRVFYLTAGSITFDGLVITEGNASWGGSIYNEGATLRLRNSTLSENSATTHAGSIYNEGGNLRISNSHIFENTASLHGGGIYNDGGTVTVFNSSISNNSTGSDGGGIYNEDGTTTIDTSTFSNNTANNGGGIGNNGGTLMVSNSTFSNNSAGADGGGIFTWPTPGILTVTNSTFSGNSASYGGGIRNVGGTLTVASSTFSDNSAVSQGGGISNSNGGIFHLQNTVLANSIGNEDCNSSEVLLSDINNLIEVNNGCGTPVSNADPQLGPLADNGGSTWTHALPPSSPAINAGDPAFIPPPDYDQRGPGYPRVFDGRIDIGAFEYSPPENNIFLPVVIAPGEP